MGLVASLVVVYGISLGVLGGAFAAALGFAAWHRRRSRIAAYALDPAAGLREGPALLRGAVEADDGAPAGPVLALEVPPGGGPWRVRAQPFRLRLPSGLEVRVEPEEDARRLELDQTFTPGRDAGARAYTAEIRPGDTIHLEGVVRREIDARATGKGYRDAARAWVVRAPERGRLRVVSAVVVALHAARARFHARWAVVLGGALAVMHAGVLLPFHRGVLGGAGGALRRGASIGAGQLLLVLVLTALLPLFYRMAAEQTRPWIDRRIPR